MCVPWKMIDGTTFFFPMYYVCTRFQNVKDNERWVQKFSYFTHETTNFIKTGFDLYEMSTLGV